MKISRFRSGPSAEPRQRGQFHPPPRAVASPGSGGHAPVYPATAHSAASTKPRAGRGRSPAAWHAVARWLRRALADSARAWALAAGVPPHLYGALAADELAE